jgi:chorismate-pyruvate lyase
MRICVVHNAILDVSHVVFLRAARISTPTAGKHNWICAAALLATVLSLAFGSGTACASAESTLRTFREALLAGDSATLTLRAWCDSRHLADPPVITAQLALSASKPADTRVRALLAVGSDEPVAYRHVQLACGGHVLSEADNWYVPSRLTAAMNRRLSKENTPFGQIVAPLNFRRRTIESRILLGPVSHKATAWYVLRQRAVLIDAAGRPFSVVVERYTRELLDEGRSITPGGR